MNFLSLHHSMSRYRVVKVEFYVLFCQVDARGLVGSETDGDRMSKVADEVNHQRDLATDDSCDISAVEVWYQRRASQR